MTEMDKLFNRKPDEPPRSLIDVLGSQDKLIDITVWYDYDPGRDIPYRYILALLVLFIIKVILKRRST